MHVGADLDSRVSRVEHCVVALQASLRLQSVPDTEAQARDLHQALAQAVAAFAACPGGVTEPLRRRLSRVGGQLGRQRESLARAAATLDRAVEVMMPKASARTFYSAQGVAAIAPRAGAIVV